RVSPNWLTIRSVVFRYSANDRGVSGKTCTASWSGRVYGRGGIRYDQTCGTSLTLGCRRSRRSQAAGDSFARTTPPVVRRVVHGKQVDRKTREMPCFGPRSQVVRQRFAKPSFPGSNPGEASELKLQQSGYSRHISHPISMSG